MKDLVTIACNRDKNLLLLQAESIQKFLDPCTHWVVVNEIDCDLSVWQKILKPYYTNHKLNLLKRQHFIRNYTDVSGYALQNALKFLIANFIKDDYLVVDTKNFFIKPTNINEWDHFIGNGIIQYIDNVPESIQKIFTDIKGNTRSLWIDCIEDYAIKLAMKPLTYHLAPMTPFKLSYEKLKPLMVQDLVKLLIFDINGEPLRSPSEFCFYTYLVKDDIKFGKNICMPPKERKALCGFKYYPNGNFEKELKSEEIFSLYDESNIKVLGYHKKFIDDCGPEHIVAINNYLKKIGLTFQF